LTLGGAGEEKNLARQNVRAGNQLFDFDFSDPLIFPTAPAAGRRVVAFCFEENARSPPSANAIDSAA